MLKKFWGLLFIAFLHLPISCNSDNSGPIGARIQALKTEIVSIDAGRIRPWALQTIALWDRLGIRVQPDSIEYISHSLDFSLSNVVRAREPAPPDFPLIDEFVIIADSTFTVDDELISPGDTVNQLFWIFGNRATSISEFIELQNEQSWIFGYEEDLVLRLINPPSDTIQSSFQVFIQFEDGEIVETQTGIFRVRGGL